jgi:hypothetical protein
MILNLRESLIFIAIMYLAKYILSQSVVLLVLLNVRNPSLMFIIIMYHLQLTPECVCYIHQVRMRRVRCLLPKGITSLQWDGITWVFWVLEAGNQSLFQPGSYSCAEKKLYVSTVVLVLIVFFKSYTMNVFI